MAIMICAIVVSASAQAAAGEEQEQNKADYGHVVLENTWTYPLHSEVTGRDYLLYVGYPDSYASNPERKYPVVYMTDGYWDFIKMNSLGTNLWTDKAAPEYIVVGIGYADKSLRPEIERAYELSPTTVDYGIPSQFKMRMGGSDKFLQAIKTEIIPFVETQTRADPSYRVMAGSSLGGLFSLFCMYEEPGLFQGIIAASPTVSWDHFWLFNRASELRMKAVGDDMSGRFSVPCRLFMSVGNEEPPFYVGEIKAFDQIISCSGYDDFSYKFRIIDGFGHRGSVAEAYGRGLRYVLEPLNVAAR